MNTHRQLAPVALLLATLVAAGCNRTGTSSTSTDAGAQDASTSGGMFTGLASEAQKKIATENLSIGNDSSNLPKAELTPQGDLLIAGNKVAVTPEQHALLVRHRELLEKVATDGVAVGMQGVDLAGKAIGNAISGAISGDNAGAQARIDTDAAKIKATARQLCDELPALLDSQQKLAAALPEFRPYASMTTDNAKDCHSD
jgi:hypothetical protein